MTQRVLATIFFGFCLIWFVAQFYTIKINVSDSLPQHIFLVIKNEPVKKGDYLAFYAKHNGVYPTHVPFVKIVGGVSGDKVSRKGELFYVNDHEIGQAKKQSKYGMLLEPGPTGTLGKDQYFVYTNNKDSFDSRYQNIGWVNQDEILGRAIPLL